LLDGDDLSEAPTGQVEDETLGRVWMKPMGLEPILPTPAHAALLDRAVESLRSDDRVLAVLLGGSVADGEADEESDLDLTLIVDDAAADQFSLDLEGWLRRVAGAVAVAPAPVPNLVTSLMGDGLRLDVTVERRSSLAGRRRAMVALHDPSGVVGVTDILAPQTWPRSGERACRIGWSPLPAFGPCCDGAE
jgi:predicted nucleotidyltransferase